jgi:hypothetical protein
MPRIIVTADPLSTDPSNEAPILLDEQVRSVHLSTDHAAAQLVERLAWAVSDAESAEIEIQRSVRSSRRAHKPVRSHTRTTDSRARAKVRS